MNVLEGHIISIRSHGNLSLVRIETGSVMLSVVIIETVQSAPYLKIGNEIKALFKETEVIVARSHVMDISVQNRIPCEVKQIESGDLLTRVEMDFKGNRISALIPTESQKELNILIGDQVFAMVKTNEIMLSE